MKRDMEKEKTRGRTRRKQPSQVAGFLYREGRKWCAAALSLCMILNNMASVTWAAESAAEKEVIFKLTSRSLYEALQEAVREETMADDHFLFEGKEKDVEAYEKLLLLDDDLYELKPEFENKDEVTDAEKKNDLQLRIFASLGWETDPEREYQVVGDEKIIFCLSNASETEQTAVIQVDEKTTEEIVLVPGSAVVIDGKGEEESLEAESGEESKEDGKADEIESGESEGQAEEENNSEGIKGVGGNGGAGGASGGNGGNSGNGSNGENGSNSSDSSNSSEREDIVESGSSAEGEDSAESEGTVESETSAKNEGSAGNESSVENKNSAENEGKADEPAADAEENRNDETQEKADAEGQDKESKDSQETVNKPETGNSQENTKEPGNTQENTNTQDKAEEKDERKDEEVKNNPTSEKEETEKPDKAESENNESEKSGKEESGNTKNGNADKADTSDNKESSKSETSEKSESGNTSTNKGGKSDTGKTENDRSGNSDSSKKSESTKKSSDSGSSDNSSDKGKEVSAEISRNVIHLVTDNLEVSVLDDKEETESVEETTIIDTQEEQKEETIEEESEEIKIETEEVKTEIEEAEAETEEVTTKTEEVKTENASPSNVEDDEIEGELYAPVVMNEESIIVFVTTAEELGLNRAELRKASDSNAERVSSVFEKEVELENVIVQVRADENVLPEGVILQVKELKEEGEHAEQYEEAKEALDSKGTEYDGMMALDISFLDKKGREIEPDGNVQVSIKVKKEALPEEADLESIAVQHLAEEKGEIFVEEVADHGDKTEGKVEVQAEEHVEAAFEVNSFSTFIVTWMVGDNAQVVNFTLNFYSLNGEGEKKDISEDISFPYQNIDIYEKDLISEGENAGYWIFPIDEFFSSVQGYVFDHIEFTTKPYSYNFDKTTGSYNPIVVPDVGLGKEEIVSGTATSIKVKKVGGYGFGYLVEISKKDISAPIICPSVYWGDRAEITLDICYRETSLEIRNDILNNGQLEASRDLEPGQSYVWYKWSKDLNSAQCPEITDQNGKKTRDPQYQVLMKPVAGNKWNLELDGKILNAVHDGGANHYYLVTIRDKDGNEIMASSPFLVDFSDKIENGSFESPKLTGTPKFFQYDKEADGLIWKSTTPHVEIVREDSVAFEPDGHYLDGGEKSLPDGTQCAELNAKREGALYQDVLTAPGATLHWSLWHRARGNNTTASPEDTMYVVIMPKSMAEEKLKETDINSLVDEIKANPENYPDSTRVWELTSPRRWTFYTDDYVVGEGQYLTRFFFVAGKTATGNKSVGNLLDDIRFGSESAEIKKCGVSITKIVSGVENIEKYNLSIKLTKTDGTYHKDIPLNQFTNVGGSYSEAKNITDLLAGEYTIEEVLNEDFGIPATVSMEKVEVDDDGTITKTLLPVYDLDKGKPKTTITVNEGELISIEITNSYANSFSNSFVVKKEFENGIGKEFDKDDTAFSDVEFGLYLADQNWNNPSEKPIKSGKIRLTENNGSSDKDATGIIEFSSLLEGYYILREISPPTGYLQAEDKKIFVGELKNKAGVYLYEEEEYRCVSDNGESVVVRNLESEEVPDIPGAILPDTGGPGLAMFERYGWFLLMLALLMAGVEVRCYGERKYRRVSAGQHEEFEDPL